MGAKVPSPLIKEVVAVRLSPSEQQRIRELAQAHGVAFSVALRAAVEVGLNKILETKREKPR